MTGPTRESLLVKTFSALADTMVAGYDVVELLQVLVERSTEVVGARAAGILLAGSDERLEVVASTAENSRLIALMEFGAGDNPCVEAFATGQVVAIERLDEGRTAWPVFAERARELGYAAVHAVPMRLRSDTIGALTLFLGDAGRLSDGDADAARALADVATIGILQERAFREADIARGQLQRALDSRVVIEQAKGFLAHTHAVGMDEAFRLMRQAARSQRMHLETIARGVLDGTVEL
jgi:hypothetical protein